MWRKPYSFWLHLFQHAEYANVEGVAERRYTKMPPVEETFASYLSQGESSFLKAPALSSAALQATSCLNGRAYVAAGQAGGALQAYQADLLKDLDEDKGLSPEAVEELRAPQHRSGSPHHQADRRCHSSFNDGNGGYGEAPVGQPRSHREERKGLSSRCSAFADCALWHFRRGGC